MVSTTVIAVRMRKLVTNVRTVMSSHRAHNVTESKIAMKVRTRKAASRDGYLIGLRASSKAGSFRKTSLGFYESGFQAFFVCG